MKQPLFQPLKNGRYQTAPTPKFTAKEGEGDPPAGGGEKLSAAQLTELNNITHKAITKRLSDPAFKESVGAIAGEIAGAAVATATEGLTSKIDELIAAKPADDGKKPPTGGGGDWKDSPEYKAMMKRDQDRDAEVAALKLEREEEKSTSNRSEERKALEGALRKAGVEEVKIRTAAATLIHEDKVLQRSDSGEIIYRINRGDYNEDMTVEAGVTSYLDTDEGKAFLPAAGASGTGVVGDSTNKGNNSSGGDTKLKKDEAVAVVNQWLGQI